MGRYDRTLERNRVCLTHLDLSKMMESRRVLQYYKWQEEPWWNVQIVERMHDTQQHAQYEQRIEIRQLGNSIEAISYRLQLLVKRSPNPRFLYFDGSRHNRT